MIENTLMKTRRLVRYMVRFLYYYFIPMETGKEKINEPRLCKQNLQIENCRECLFNVLCHLEDQIKRHTDNWSVG